MNFNKTLKNIKTYEPGKPIELIAKEYGFEKEEIIKLASNENPYGVSPKARQYILEQIERVHQYPDDNMTSLKQLLCEKFDIKDENLIIGAGSDQVLEFIIDAKCDEASNILTAKTTFSMYEIYANMVGAKVLKTPSPAHDLNEFLEIYKKENIDVIFLCTPNNPLGEALDNNDILEFLKQIKEETLVVIDGAYMEFASFKDKKKEISPKYLVDNFSNVVYTGTFSKAYGLGGMRVGYGIGSANIISNLYKLRPPFNVNILGVYGACGALQDEKFVNECIEKNFEEMQRFVEFLNKKKIEYIPSFTNFITLKFTIQNSEEISNYLLKNGIIVRNLSSSYGMNAIRITIGTKEQNNKLFKILENYL